MGLLQLKIRPGGTPFGIEVEKDHMVFSDGHKFGGGKSFSGVYNAYPTVLVDANEWVSQPTPPRRNASTS